MTTALRDDADIRNFKRRIRISAFPLAAVIASSAPAAADAAAIDAIIYTCDACATYSDLLTYLINTNNGMSELGDGIIPGFPSGLYAIPGQTKLLVMAKRAPLSFYFDYTATRVKVPYVSAYYYRYNFTPTAAHPANDDGAISQDFRIFQAQRATGLPADVTLPKQNFQLETMGYNYALDLPWLVAKEVSFVIFRMGVPGFRTLPGIFNWKFLPSVSMTYKGKYYVLYEGETIEVKLFDGTKVELMVVVESSWATLGYLRVTKVTPPPAVGSPTSLIPLPSIVPSPGRSAGQVSSLNPLTFLYDSTSLSIWVSGYAPLATAQTPSLTIIQYDPANQTIPMSVFTYTYDGSSYY